MRIRLAAPAVALVLVATLATGAGSTPALHEWSPPTDVSGGALTDNLALGVAGNGDAIFLGRAGDHLAGLVRRAGTWSTPQDLSIVGETPAMFDVTVAADPNGTMAAGWFSSVDATSLLGVRVAISRPGSSTFEPAEMMLAAEYNSFSPPQMTLDDAGNLVIASVVSTDNGAHTSLRIMRCSIAGRTLCQPVEIVDGVFRAQLIEPSSGHPVVVWATLTGDVRIADVGPTGLTGVGAVVTGQTTNMLEAWAGGGSVVLQWNDGNSWVHVARVGGTWNLPASQADRITDVAFAPDGTMYELVIGQPGLTVRTTPDDVLATDVHEVSPGSPIEYPSPTLQRASDGSIVVVWGEYGSQTVHAALAIGGVWAPSTDLGTFHQCGGEPILSSGSGDQVLAAWTQFVQTRFVSSVAEMVMATTTTSTTSTTAPSVMRPSFAC